MAKTNSLLAFVNKADLASMDYEELVELGREVSEVKTYSQWLLGKLGSQLMEKQEGEKRKYGDLIQYAKDIGQHYGTLKMYMSTYRKFTQEDPDFSPEQYSGSMPWGVIQLVANKSETPIKLLEELADKGVTNFEHAYREIKSEQTGKEVPTKPKFKFHFDDKSGKWKLEFALETLDLIDWSDVKEQLLNYLEGLR